MKNIDLRLTVPDDFYCTPKQLKTLERFFKQILFWNETETPEDSRATEIRNHLIRDPETREICVGSQDLESVLKEWLDVDFSSTVAGKWIKASCFEASVAKELQLAGILPEHVGLMTTGSRYRTLAYLYCTNELSLHALKIALERA